jgi:peptidoglycan/LPS O-acetylase OafA/YrhL
LTHFIRGEAGAAKRYPALDGLRGLTALMVAGCHFICAFDESLLTGNPDASHFSGGVALSQTPIIFLFNPDFCVAIFFVLSGFVLSASLDKTDLLLPWLMLRRWIRLAPPVIGTSLLAWIIPAFGLNFAQSAARLSKSDWLSNQYAYISMTITQFERLLYESAISLWYSCGSGGEIARFYNSNLWTMPIEFLGSIGLFAMYRIFLIPFAPKVVARLLVITVILALLWHTNFYGFPAGAGLFELQKRARHSPLLALFSSRFLSLICGSIILTLGIFSAGTPFNINQHGDFYAPLTRWLYRFTAPSSPITMLHHFGAICVVAGVLIFRPAQWLLEHTIAQYLGKISFMVYLVQIPILCSVGAGIFILATSRMEYGFAAAIAAAAYFSAVVASAAVLTRFVDEPATLLSKKLGQRFEPRWLGHWRPKIPAQE